MAKLAAAQGREPCVERRPGASPGRGTNQCPYGETADAAGLEPVVFGRAGAIPARGTNQSGLKPKWSRPTPVKRLLAGSSPASPTNSRRGRESMRRSAKPCYVG